MNTTKRIIPIFALIAITLFSFTSVNKDFLPTKLQVTVIDRLGNFVSGATVTIYTTEDDYRNNENPVAAAVTDEKGRAVLTDLNPVSYFIDARKGDENNNGEGVKTAALEEGKKNKVNTVIE